MEDTKEKLRVIFANKDRSSEYHFDYDLFDNHFTEKWLAALKEELNQGKSFRPGLIYGRVFQDIETLVREMNESIAIVNAVDDTPRFTKMPKQDMDLQYLMAIHQQYEKAEQDAEFSSRLNQETRNHLLKVNELIHRYETLALDSEEFHINLVFDDPATYPLDVGDFKFFRPDHFDGWIYLDYGTTGVTLLDSYNKKLPQKPVPQRTFQAGCKLLFNGDCERSPEYLQGAETWLSEQFNISLNDKTNRLGYIPLGAAVKPWSREELIKNLKIHNHSYRVEIL